MAVFRCKMCGGDLEVINQSSVCECQYCGTKQTVPLINDEKIANLFNRANQLRMVNRFDDAKKVYEDILLEDSNSAEAHWGVVLCKYGIEYVDDNKTNKKIPTCHRTVSSSIFADIDYIETINHSDSDTKIFYEQEAEIINNIQMSILAQSKNEEKFDVFICYKETDEITGDRTEDSVIAQDLYYELEKKGYKTFFARKTLEGQLGSAYEPIIFSALSSSKVMVVLGTKPEYFNSVWLKNEWNRYLDFAKDGNKLLIPAYRGFSPYELPNEFSSLQSLDMGRIGFMQDLLDAITKIVKYTNKETVDITRNFDKDTSIITETVSVSSLLKRVDLFLVDKNWNSANEYCEKILDIEPENHIAYIRKVMAKNHCPKESDLYKFGNKFIEDSDFRKAVDFANEDTRKTYLSYPQKYYQIQIKNEENKLEQIYSDNKAKEGTALSRVNECSNMLVPLKISYEKHIKNGKKAKIISVVILAIILLLFNIIMITGNSSEDAGDMAGMSITLTIFYAALIGVTINGIVNCIGASTKNRMFSVCRNGLSEIDNYNKVNKCNLDNIKNQKELIVSDYKLLSYFGCDVPNEKLNINMDGDIKYYSQLEKNTDFDFAISFLNKENARIEKEKQRLMKRPETKSKAMQPKKKSISLIACVFGGWLGLHKFYEGKIWMGLLYLCTFGLFCVGIAYDFFDILAKEKEYF